MLKKMEYYLMPESGYIGEYEKKEAHYKIKHGTIADMIHDSKMLWKDYDKVIPKYDELNKLLQSGCYERLVEWIPLKITKDEYNTIVSELLNIQMSKPYKKD